MPFMTSDQKVEQVPHSYNSEAHTGHMREQFALCSSSVEA